MAWSIGANPQTIAAEDILSVICKSDIHRFYMGLYDFPDKQRFATNMTEEDWFEFFETLVKNPEWAHKVWAFKNHETHIEFMIEKMPSLRNHPLTPILTSDRYKKWLQESKKAWYDRKKERMDSVKEELMAITYHPSRFIAWTLSSEDQKDLVDHWQVVSETLAPLRQVLEEVRFVLCPPRVEN